MKLYEVPRGKVFKITDSTITIPPDAPIDIKNILYTMGNVDGMYCNVHSQLGVRFYFAIWTEVEIINSP